ncbi:hypothetical protein QCA50_008765 [Cerrena zonata]|uniref:Uncharacterized protein n=1 Tax=Cerrena zonata TaxID=2478898 RepID=A0AAW0GEL2_9APHY
MLLTTFLPPYPLPLMATPPPGRISAIKKTARGYHTYSKVIPRSREIQLDVAKEAYGSSVGPIPAEEFLDRFMPTSRENMSKVNKVETDFFHGIPTKGLEKDMCKSFVKIMNKSKLFPGLEFVDTFDNEDRQSGCKFRPDGGVYSTGAGRISALEWRLLQLFIEWKATHTLDPYRASAGLDEVLAQRGSIPAAPGCKKITL